MVFGYKRLEYGWFYGKLFVSIKNQEFQNGRRER